MCDNQPNQAGAGNGICIVVAEEESFPQERLLVMCTDQRAFKTRNYFWRDQGLDSQNSTKTISLIHSLDIKTIRPCWTESLLVGPICLNHTVKDFDLFPSDEDNLKHVKSSQLM